MGQWVLSAESLGFTADDFGPKIWRSVLAELIATLLFVFVGAGSVVVLGGVNDTGGLVAVALTHGLAIALLVAATAKISGGHINPAVTFGAVITGRMKLSTGVLYLGGQITGAVIGALLLEAAIVGQYEGNLGAHSLNLELLDGQRAAWRRSSTTSPSCGASKGSDGLASSGLTAGRAVAARAAPGG